VWLGWDISLSVLGDAIEIKSTYASITSSAQRPDIFVDIGATLDSLLPRLLGKRVLIKIDAEGSELDVLAGGLEVLHQVRPPIIFESIDRGARPLTLRFLSNHGYVVLELPWVLLSDADKLDM
jgi:hypothetical protein